MPESFAYLRFDAASSPLPGSPQIGDSEKKNYDTYNQELRDNEQFKRISTRYSYDPSKIGYLIEKDGDQYWIRLFEYQYDSGKRFAPDSELKAILKKFYEPNDLDDPHVGLPTPQRSDTPESPVQSPPTPLPSPASHSPVRSPSSTPEESLDSTPIVGPWTGNDLSPSSPARRPYPDSTPITRPWDSNDPIPSSSRGGILRPDSTPRVGDWNDSSGGHLPISRSVRFQDSPASQSYASRAWNILTGEASDLEPASFQRERSLSSSNPLDELYAPLREQEIESRFAKQIAISGSQHSSKSREQIDPSTVFLLKEEYEKQKKECARLQKALDERSSAPSPRFPTAELPQQGREELIGRGSGIDLERQSELETRASAAEKSLEELQGRLLELQEANRNLAHSLDELRNPVQESERIKLLLEENDQTHAMEIEELTKKLKELESSNYVLREALDAAESERKDTSIFLSEQMQKIDAMASQIDQLKKQPAPLPPQRIESPIQDRSPEISLHQEANALLVEREEELSALQKELSASLEKLREKEEQVDDLRGQLETNFAELEGIKVNLSHAGKEHQETNRQLQQQLIEAAAEIAYLKEKQTTLEEQLNSELEKNDLLQKEHQTLNSALAAKEKALGQWIEDGEDWKTKISAYQEMRDAEVAHLKELNLNLEGRLSAAIQKQKELSATNAEYVELLAEPRYVLDKSKEEIAGLTEQLEESQIKLQEAEARCEELKRVYRAACEKFGGMLDQSRTKEAGDAKELFSLKKEIQSLQGQIGKNVELLSRMDRTLVEKGDELRAANETIVLLEEELGHLRAQLGNAEQRRNRLLGDLSRTIHLAPETPNSFSPNIQMAMEDLIDTEPAASFNALRDALPTEAKEKLAPLWEMDRRLLEAADGVRLVDSTGRQLSYRERTREDATLALIRDGDLISLEENRDLEQMLGTILKRMKIMSHSHAEGDIITSGRLSPRINQFLHNIGESFLRDPILQQLSHPNERSERKSLIIAAHFLCNYMASDSIQELYPLAEELIDLYTNSPENLQNWLAVKFRGGVATQHLIQDLLFLDAMYNLQGEQSKPRGDAALLRQQLFESGLLPALRRMLLTR